MYIILSIQNCEFDAICSSAVQEYYTNLENCIVQTVNNAAEKDRKKKKRIILSESTKKLIDQRELIKPFIHDSPRNRIEYSELNKLTKRKGDGVVVKNAVKKKGDKAAVKMDVKRKRDEVDVKIAVKGKRDEVAVEIAVRRK